MVKWYGKYGKKASPIVISYGQYGKKLVEMGKDAKNME